jgi:hypothetical protein
MQPMKGRKYVVPARACVATKSTLRAVVMPGLTGLPRVPRKTMSSARSPSTASRPPTMLRGGHVSR